MKGVKCFNVKGKLAPHYVGPFNVLDQVGEVAYRLELPPNPRGVHNVFHVSQLRKCLRVPEEQLPIDELHIQDNLTYEERPIKILDMAERTTRSKVIKLCKVQWSHHSEDEATWEREEQLKEKYPDLFAD